MTVSTCPISAGIKLQGPKPLALRSMGLRAEPGVYVVSSGDCISYVGSSGRLGRPRADPGPPRHPSWERARPLRRALHGRGAPGLVVVHEVGRPGARLGSRPAARAGDEVLRQLPPV